MYSIYNNINMNNLNSSIRYDRDHTYTDEDFERIRKSGDNIKINNTIFANGPSCLCATYLKQHEYQQYLQYLNKINTQSSEKKKEKPKKETKEKKEVKEKKLKLNNKKVKLSDIEKLIKVGATVHISV
jgi:hypothetical protein